MIVILIQNNLQEELLHFTVMNKLNYKIVINKNISLENKILLIYAAKNQINVNYLEKDKNLSKYNYYQLSLIIKLLSDNKNPILLQQGKMKNEEADRAFLFTNEFYEKIMNKNVEQSKYENIIQEDIPEIFQTQNNDIEFDN